ncbi:1-deoxy-D-xylulose-5-phosphate reductoisomerase [Alistipes sp. dk3620]|uniref:1-deoxy-D-xylulose-5-phosphate reductoisomerase n=1 Tax=unclassified Alistipes TaxID=2608932 RepID=UPI001297B4AC|nr:MULTISPECIES: 1-deoxy-D-xylulose-5-phosphate reductoisomerase [unclassified Alistipes]MQX26357.1 1-deoxy-D-xylulose-5-phosphate reductoisomerase [Alistipes sp. dk3620]QGA23780.1 1-deoxy-D-xylulose-5-phosphate reductoisomerase [Alistipes sp. dk3624]HIV60206.1 1-deoxy-D-xylulose-5-phosphate reductoisomerase [Candidatus Alistipes pullistercoris]
MTQSKQRLAVLGSTGSIGTQTLDIVRRYGDRFEITTLSAHSNWKKLVEQAVEFTPDNVVIADKTHYTAVRDALADHPVKVYAGSDALEQVVCSEQVDTVVMALVGYSGLFPTVSALKHGKKVALANKECLVVAGEIVTRLSAEHRAPIIPVDSEHSAIFQCLTGEHSAVEKVILTASGGPFLHRPAEELERVSVEEALNHPSWCMGAKVTIDSASLMNKGFEVIEARWLFGLRPEQIDVVIHPRSVIHSMVQFGDGAVKAQIGTPDMHLPIQYALTFPQRLPLQGPRIDFCKLGCLEFFEPDPMRFPNLALAFECLRRGGNAGAVLNAANEVAVAAFLDRKIRFTDIARINEETLGRTTLRECVSLEEYRRTDREARQTALSML